MSKETNITPSNYIKFYPRLRLEIGCEKATLIVGKLEYFFSISKFVNGFYKFVEPCSHPLYREGDSWSEELGVSRKVFNRAFDVIGVRYKSKTDFLRADDKFQGKLYASYHDRATNRTYYVRNHDFVAQFLEGIFKNKNLSTPSSSENQKKNEIEKDFKEILPQNPDQNLEISSPSECHSWNGPFGRSYARESSFFHKKTSSLDLNKNVSSDVFEQRERTLTEGMIKIWNEEIGELGVGAITISFLKRLYEALKIFFNRSLESWKAYCQMIASSKFLMGEAHNKFFKKAWITWAIKEETIDRIRGGGFCLRDRQTNRDKEMERLNSEISTVENKKNAIEEKIKEIKEEETKKRKIILKEKIATFSQDKKKYFEEEFETFLKKENNSMTEEFRKSKWQGMFIIPYFHDFLEERLSSDLFKTPVEEDAKKILQSSGLLNLLEEVCDTLTQLKQKRREIKEKNKALDTLIQTNFSEALLFQNRQADLLGDLSHLLRVGERNEEASWIWTDYAIRATKLAKAE